jgi:broad specificity phosphatase PhoE
MARILMIRHGETEGESSVRFHGSEDVALSEAGREQMRSAARELPDEAFDRVVASPLSRSWEGARIVLPGARIALEPDFREIDFGAWEGLTKEEIAARDPASYAAWQERRPDFEFPGGERRGDFRARVERGLERQLASGARSMLLVAHKGVMRTIVEKLTGQPLEDGEPELGGTLQLSRGADGQWRLGRRTGDPRVA